jgi:hypothetical protein
MSITAPMPLRRLLSFDLVDRAAFWPVTFPTGKSLRAGEERRINRVLGPASDVEAAPQSRWPRDDRHAARDARLFKVRTKSDIHPICCSTIASARRNSRRASSSLP